ncbi:hypothetical protein [Tardiphaga sp. P5_C7]
MVATTLADGIRFNATSTGTGDFVDASAVTGYRRGASNLTDGRTYRYRAENASLSEYERGSGVWNNSTSTLARTTIEYSSTGSKVAFSSVPQVGITPGPDDIAVVGANVLINSDFRINQRSYASAAALTAGSYGHDRWKAGAGGGDYSYSQLASSTQVTIAASKTLIQVVEDKNVEGGTYVLSWTGTAQARAGVNSATPSGAYAASPLIISSQTAGTVMSVEFNTGTLGKVKLELGSVPTPYAMSRYPTEFRDCLRYYEFGSFVMDSAVNATTTVRQFQPRYMVQKRVTPTLGVTGAVGSPTVTSVDVNSFSTYSAVGSTYMGFNWTASAEL